MPEPNRGVLTARFQPRKRSPAPQPGPWVAFRAPGRVVSPAACDDSPGPLSRGRRKGWRFRRQHCVCVSTWKQQRTCRTVHTKACVHTCMPVRGSWDHFPVRCTTPPAAGGVGALLGSS